MEGKQTKFPSKKQPPRIQNLGGKRGCICTVDDVRILAGQLSRLQVAGRLLPMAGRPRVRCD